jgi:hypothetical protein
LRDPGSPKAQIITAILPWFLSSSLFCSMIALYSAYGIVIVFSIDLPYSSFYFYLNQTGFEPAHVPLWIAWTLH